MFVFYLYIKSFPPFGKIAESKIGIHSSHNEFREFISWAIPPEATLIMFYRNSYHGCMQETVFFFFTIDSFHAYDMLWFCVF